MIFLSRTSSTKTIKNYRKTGTKVAVLSLVRLNV